MGIAFGRKQVHLEFIEDGDWEGGPLILLYGGPREEIRLLQDALRSLSGDVGRRVSIHELPFVRATNACAVVAISENIDRGVATVGPAQFEWGLTPASWNEVDSLLQGFFDGGGGFQFLNEASGPTVIYSRRRSW